MYGESTYGKKIDKIPPRFEKGDKGKKWNSCSSGTDRIFLVFPFFVYVSLESSKVLRVYIEFGSREGRKSSGERGKSAAI